MHARPVPRVGGNVSGGSGDNKRVVDGNRRHDPLHTPVNRFARLNGYGGGDFRPLATATSRLTIGFKVARHKARSTTIIYYIVVM